uniref:Uncharacterized protein n=1 Tax=Arion vulgaris TaxID=1028688 RepID=A0A0B7A0I1_9EUPU
MSKTVNQRTPLEVKNLNKRHPLNFPRQRLRVGHDNDFSKRSPRKSLEINSNGLNLIFLLKVHLLYAPFSFCYNPNMRVSIETTV